MNGFERINKALNGEWPDKRPVMLHNFMMAAEEAGYSMKTFREDPRKAADAFIQSVEKYDLDGVMVDFDTTLIAGAIGVPVDYPVDEPARIPRGLIPSWDQMEQLKEVDLSKNERVQIWLETCRLIKEYFGDEVFVRGNCDQAPFSAASMVRGAQEWMLDMMMPGPEVEKLLDYCSDVCIQFIDLMAKTGVDMISNGDSPAGPEMISPQMFRQFALPYEKRLVETAHAHHLPYVNHICGNADLIIKDMLDSGTDGLELDYKTDINKILEHMGNGRLFIGNIDPSGVLALGDKELVRQKTRELLEIYKDSPRLVVNAGCAIPPKTPPENIAEMIKTVREY
ncbi:MAG: uroporphyrinogen decarboxylase family protein [Cytophagales bacterium]|nr:uroporphyrinogen decarboxylase family protein [Cytophagales bacterium]